MFFRAQPRFSVMQYVILIPTIIVTDNGTQDLEDEKASVRLIVDLCPALKVVKVYVYHLEAEEAGKMWRFLEVATDLEWHIFQAFP